MTRLAPRSLNIWLIPCFVLAFGLISGLAEASAVIAPTTNGSVAEEMRVTTSGSLETSWGPRTLIGVTDSLASDPTFTIGSIPIGQRGEGPWAGDLHLTFEFNGGLPSITLEGRVRWLAYNPMETLVDPVVKTSATEAQIDLYPDLFQRLIEHPEWIRTMSFGTASPTMDLALMAHPRQPGDPSPVPEPSALAVFALTLAGLGWKARRSRV